MVFRYAGKSKLLSFALFPWRTLVWLGRKRRVISQMSWAILVNLRFLVEGKGSRGTRNLIIGITVSTNYADILSEVLDNNLSKLDHWFIVTMRDDLATRQLLKDQQKVTVLYWNPFLEGHPFNKGSGIRLAQQAAYEAFKNCWYLVLDSDVSLPRNFRA